jgi:hypothetical protein
MLFLDKTIDQKMSFRFFTLLKIQLVRRTTVGKLPVFFLGLFNKKVYFTPPPPPPDCTGR